MAYLDDLRKIPDELFSLDKIQVLELRFLPKLEEIPSAIAKLRNLEQLYVNGTAIITIPKEISDLPRLKVLNLSQNKIGKITYRTR